MKSASVATFDAAKIKVGARDKVYTVAKIAAVTSALQAEGITARHALEGVGVTERDLNSPSCKVSLAQTIQSYRNAIRFTKDPCFAVHLGLKFRVSVYGMYGFALLSSPSLREAIRFGLSYHELASPEVHLTFGEQGNVGVFTIEPHTFLDADPAIYRFLVELLFGTLLALQRDMMGTEFSPEQLQVTYPCGSAEERKMREDLFCCTILCEQPANRFVFPRKWLDRTPDLSNSITYSSLVELCDKQLAELHHHLGASGRVRKALLSSLTGREGLDDIARKLSTSGRTLRRQLRQEGTSFRKIADELRMHLAIKYLRETNLTTEEVAAHLGFSDAANFRQAFRRWTSATPGEFRREDYSRRSTAAGRLAT